VEIYLRKCLDSVLQQGFSDMELILVDDGSPDRCGEICDEYAGLYPSAAVVVHQGNQGLGGARNAGIGRARGRYIFFVDGDDTIAEGALGTIADALREHDYPDMLVFGGCLVGQDGRVIPERLGGVLADSFIPCGERLSLSQAKELLLGFPSACLRVVKREVYAGNGIQFPEGLWFEDNATVLQLLACSGSIVCIDPPLYHYLQREGSITKSGGAERRVRDIVEVFEIIFNWYGRRGLLDEYRPLLVVKAVHEMLVVQAVMALLAGGPRELLGSLVEAVEKLDKDYLSNPYLARFDRKTRMKIRLLAKRRFRTLAAIFRVTALIKKARKR